MRLGPDTATRPGVPRRVPRPRLVALATLGCLTLAACAGPAPAPGGGAATTSTTSAPTVSPSVTSGTAPAPTPTATQTDLEPPFPSTVGTLTADPTADAALTVTDVRAATHDGYDRVVFQLGGTGAPGWRVGYVDKAVDDPSGKPVPVQGAGVLQVMISGTGYPADTGQTEWAGSPLNPGLPVVQEVDVRGVFEAQTQAFIGVARAGAPFRVLVLTAPERLVVDVQR